LPSSMSDPRELLLHELQDLYYAEKAITKALPTMIREADDDELVAGLEVVAHDLVDLGEPGPSERAERAEEPADLVAREPVVNARALLAGLHEAAPAEHLELGGGVGHPHAGGRRQRVDASFPLREQVEQLDATGMCERLAQPGELLVEHPLRLTAGHRHDPTPWLWLPLPLPTVLLEILRIMV